MAGFRGYQQARNPLLTGPTQDKHAQPAIVNPPVPDDAVTATLAILSRWRIAEKPASVILGSTRSGFIKELRTGDAFLDTRDIQDRARLLFDIYEGVYGLLRDPQAERAFIQAARDDFEGKSLLDLMTEGSQRNLIRALSFVDYVNGR